MMIFITTFSYDEYNSWDAYAISMPVSRKDIVKSKYIASIILIFIAVIFTIIISLIIGLIYILPLYYPDSNVIYSYGPSANIIYVICGVYMFFWAIRLIYNYKNFKSKNKLKNR